ncbi:glycosyltransferase family 4 protein [Pedobacter frigiditerrae]|uniref:glycosyltransferase family 4 protein n=1 Tax=Pedobacter frigiditerrae TaxID=2530452 RepID=UPI001CEC955E|nr:glycosyltransferase family 4 protein [Pedobacter frigiditerrae]
MNSPKLRIAVIADPFIPVPPLNYGGIERIIDFLVTGLTEKGHELVLLAHPESKVICKHLSYGDQNSIFKHLKNIVKVNQLKAYQPDIIHSFGRLAYLLPFLQSSTPKIMSYQREPTISQIKKAMKLVKKNTLTFTGCSAYISKQIGPYAPSFPIFNGVDLKLYDFQNEVAPDAPLIFLGRIEPIKGTHIAIEVAKKTNRKLIIAGNIPYEYQSYFDNIIQPSLNDQITYVGAVNDLQKNELLGKAAAFLMPIEWNEPFGIVMAEAMACGTPVIGFNRGSVPEVINEKIGFICSNLNDMISAISQLKNINRAQVREHCELNFGSDVIVNKYIDLYKSLILK